MKAKTNLTIKLDKEVRDEFSSLCNEIGISMAAALNALVKQSIRQQSMSFTIRDVNGITFEDAQELKRRMKELEEGKIESHDLIEVN
jgi:Predicted glycosyl hydrolase